MFDGYGYFRGKRLNEKNIEAYLRLSNLDYKNVELIKTQRLDIYPLLQKDYGKVGDCSLVSMVTCIFYWTREANLPIPLSEIYIKVEKFANKYFYNGDSYGLIPFFIKKIYQEALDYFTIDGEKVTSGYLKNVGYSIAEIKQAINVGMPVILSMLNDGKSYYKNHTVTVIGYKDFLLTDNALGNIFSKKQKEKTLLMVYDNWTTDISYIDPGEMSFISSIQY